MNLGCPNLNCKSTHFSKDGSYLRANDSRTIQRFRCSKCGKRFSKATFDLEYNQKKRRVNAVLFKLLASGVSMRRAAIILNIHRKTVKRKFLYLADKSRLMQKDLLKKYLNVPVNHMQFDDLITIEHTKLKPLSVSAAIDANSRFILGSVVSQIPAFGHLAKMSRAKYGKRPSKHKEGLEKLFKGMKDYVSQTALIESDEHKTYPEFVNRYFPNSEYKRYKGGRGCVTGQGELKKQHHDPLFKLNHTYAMLRANINRLFRRTWCTTKDPVMLKNHVDIYTAFHNSVLIS